MNKNLSLAIAMLLPMILGLILFGSSGRDDSHISFWPAWALAHGEGLINYNGDALEQSSSLLLVLLLAFIHWVTNTDIAVAGMILGYTGGAMAVFFSKIIADEVLSDRKVAAFVPWVTGSQVFLVYWSSSGMETALAAGLLTGIVAGLLRLRAGGAAVWTWPFVALWILVRPEAGLLLLTGLGLWLIFSRFSREKTDLSFSRKLLLKFGLFSLIVFSLLALFRIMYTGQPFPNPAILKASLPFLLKLKMAAKYFFDSMLGSELLLYLICWVLAAKLIIRKKTGPFVPALFSFISAGFLFIVLAGGDWMEAGRFFVPVVPLCIVQFFILFEKKPIKRIAVVLLAANAIFLALLVMFESTGTPVWTRNKIYKSDYSWFENRNRSHLKDAMAVEALDNVLQEVLSKYDQEVTIMSGQAGFVMYYISRKYHDKIRFIDFYGLSSPHILTCEPARNIITGNQPYKWDYPLYFQMADELNASCGELSKPDIIIDLDFPRDFRKDLFESNGYHYLYSQEGQLNNSSLFMGLNVNTHQFIAISDEFVAKHGINIPEKVLDLDDWVPGE